MAVPATGAASRKLGACFDNVLQRDLQLHPETATTLGLDKGANSHLRAKLSDQSKHGRAAEREATRLNIAELEAVDRAPLSERERIDLDAILYEQYSARGLHAFDFGDHQYSRTPYVVSQMSGVYNWVPPFLDTKHPVQERADADAYLNRLEQFGTALDQNTAQFCEDAAAGILPPDYILDTALVQLPIGRTAGRDAPVVRSLATRAAAAGLGTGYERQAAAIYDVAVGPALDRQIDMLRAHRAGASHDAGVWRFKDGADYYTAMLRAYTTTSRSAEDIHAFGLEQAAELTARLDALLCKLGLTKGSLAERLTALYADPRQLYPNTDAGKAEAIAFCNERLAAIRKRLPDYFRELPTTRIEVRRVPMAAEAGSPFAYSENPSLDGAIPGFVWINLQNTASMPKFALSTTIYHEGLPGHQLEGALQMQDSATPVIRKHITSSGFAEGWALYAEQLADEMGMFADDPVGEVGYLKFQLFRANRCVVDTGMHHFRWSRERAIDHLVQQQGEEPGFARREIDRYTTLPGQACSYKLGHATFSSIRDRAKARLGARYSPKEFHDTVLRYGRVPLDMLESIGNAWVETLV